MNTPKANSFKLIEKIQARIDEKKPFFSFEFFPPKTEEGAVNLYIRFDRMATLCPVSTVSNAKSDRTLGFAGK
jgi:5,10-methylenetetrahydrofolate reductase